MDTYQLPLRPLIVGTAFVLNPVATSSNTSSLHGMGNYPDFVHAYLECLVAEAGYAVGDRVEILGNDTGSGQRQEVTLAYNATTLYCNTDNLGIRITNSSNASTAITASSWKLVAVPYRVQA